MLAIIIPLIFWGCVDKSFPVTENYTETEYKTEYRTETTTEIQKEVIRSGQDLMVSYGWYNQGTTSGKWGYVCTNSPFWYFNYSIPIHSTTSVEITSTTIYPEIMAYDMDRFEEFGRSGGEDPYDQELRYCDWLNNFNSKVGGSRLLGKYSTGGDRQLLKIDTSGARSLSLVIQGNTGSEHINFSNATLNWTDTRDKEVKNDQTVAVQVPVTVEKQRTVSSTRRVPFWEALSGQ